MRLAAILAVAALPALAGPPATSLRPEARPGPVVVPALAPAPQASSPRNPFAALGRLLQPRPRPVAAAPVRPEVTRALGPGLAVSPRPASRPQGFDRTVRVAMAARRNASERIAVGPGAAGAVCGVPGIRGASIAPIAGRIRGCGLQDGVKITHVEGVALSQPANIDCRTARALHTWVRDAVIPAVGRRGGGVKGLRVAAHYACRTRNHKKGGKISEHGKGRAIDISAIELRDGSAISVLRGWRDPTMGKILKATHKAACGPFRTVLGPNADRFHQDHFHFDTARRKNGSAYCR